MYSLKEPISDCHANVHIFVGEKENHAMRNVVLVPKVCVKTSPEQMLLRKWGHFNGQAQLQGPEEGQVLQVHGGGLQERQRPEDAHRGLCGAP